MAESDNPLLLPLQRPPFGDPATHKAHPLMFQAEYDICFRHPAYEDPYDIFIILPGLDHPEGGIHHQTALLACAVIANNSFSGWLTEDRDGKVRVNVPLDGILRAHSYYFQVSNDHRDMYPISPSFDHWAFPHGKLPSVWKLDIPRAAEHPTPRQSTLNEAILSRDIRCRITNHIEGTECAHLVPRSESLWFQRNLMTLYGKQPRPGCEPVDNPRNAILLRSDIHTSFDYKRFAFVPKPKLAECSTGSVTYVTHIFCSPEPHELTALYHNVALQPLTGVAPEYLFARFAWTIFQFVSTFLQAGIPRRLAVHNSSTDSIDLNDTAKSSVKTLTGEECRMLPLRSKSRSASPKKRKPPLGEEDHCDANFEQHELKRRGRKEERNYAAVSLLDISAGSSFGSEVTGDGPWYSGDSWRLESDAETDSSDIQLEAPFPEVLSSSPGPPLSHTADIPAKRLANEYTEDIQHADKVV